MSLEHVGSVTPQKNSTSDSINYLSQIESILTKSTVHHRHGIKTQKYKNI